MIWMILWLTGGNTHMFRDPQSHPEKILIVKAMLVCQVRSEITWKHLKWMMVITTAQLHSIKSDPKSAVWNDRKLQQWSQLKLRLKTFHRSVILKKSPSSSSSLSSSSSSSSPSSSSLYYQKSKTAVRLITN